MIIGNKTRISLAFIVAGFVVAGLSLGAAHLSAAGDSPATLDQWLAQAMDKNPGILASKAKVAMAEAESRNVRFEVARQVVACWNEIEDQQRAIALAEEHVKIAEQQNSVEYASKLHVAKTALIDLKAKLARAQSELRFLGGQAPPAASASLAPSSTATMALAPLQIPHGLMLEKVRQALRRPTQIEFVETPLKDVVDYLKDLHHIEIQIDGSALPKEKQDRPITLNLKGMSLAAVFQRLEDEFFGELKVVVRDYGLLVTTPVRAQEAGYMPVADFLRLRTEVSEAELLEAQKRLAELVKVLEAGGTEAELREPRDRLAEFMYVWDGEETAAEWREASTRLNQPGRKDPAKKPAAAVPNPRRMAPQTAAPPDKEPQVKPIEPGRDPRRADNPFAP